MAIPHAQPLDVIDVHPLGKALAQARSTSLLKTDRIQLQHQVLPARFDQPEHQIDGECTILCLEGDVEVVMPGGTRRLAPWQMVLLPGGQRHALRAREASAVLVTLLLAPTLPADPAGAPSDSGTLRS